MPFTSGKQFAPFQREHDPQAGPRCTWMILASPLGPLLVIAVPWWAWTRWLAPAAHAGTGAPSRVRIGGPPHGGGGPRLAAAPRTCLWKDTT
ncbi:hypothetical protein [Kineococcus esterisolvens]|uniref:hypothetical protein n=1 Tax=unclassified Kineococcus TaxID=2621656 RepID=UPI003D7D6495